MPRIRLLLILFLFLSGAGCQGLASRRISVPAQPAGLPENLPTNIVTVVPATEGLALGATAAITATLSGMPQRNFAFMLAWSPAGDTLAAATFDGMRLYDPVVGTEKAVLEPGIECCIDYVVGRRLLAAIEPAGGWVKTWDLASQQLLYTLDKGQQPFGMLALNPDESILAVSQEDGITLWEAETGQVIAQMPGGERYTNLGFTADSRTLVGASSFASRVDIWDLESREVAKTFELSKVIRFTLDPSATRLAVDYGLNGFELVDVEAGKRAGGIPEAIGAPGSLAFSPDSQRVAVWGYSTASRTGCAAIWDLDSKERLNEFCLGEFQKVPAQPPAEYRGAAFSPDATRLALSDDRGRIDIFDLVSGEVVREIPVQ